MRAGAQQANLLHMSNEQGCTDGEGGLGECQDWWAATHKSVTVRMSGLGEGGMGTAWSCGRQGSGAKCCIFW